GQGQGDIRLSRIYPLLGQNKPWILGHQAEDGWEAPPPVYERNMDMVPGEPPCAIDRAVSDAVCETAWLLPLSWYTWQPQGTENLLSPSRTGLAILAEPS